MSARTQVLGIVLAAAAWAVAPTVVHAEGMEAHVDPKTGALAPEPVVVPEGGRAAGAAVPADPPVERVAPGGGTMVDVRGRFRPSVVVEQRPDGSLASDCIEKGSR